MTKKIFSLFFSFLIISALFIPSLQAGAYSPTGFDVSAKNALFVCMDTDEVIFSRAENEKLYPASITKIMTSVIMLESDKFNPDGKVTMTDEVLKMILGTGSSVSNLKAGEEITQLDLLHMVLMSSYGDCAYLASNFYYDSIENFVAKMNEKAQELDMTGTHYTNPIGLHDEENYTTAYDIYKLTSYALKNKTFKTVCETTRYNMAATNITGKRTISTTNLLQDVNTNYYYQYAHGVKTGYTDEAGRCLVSTASFNGYNYMCILMGCPASEKRHFTDSANLYRWAFNNFAFKEIAASGDPVCEMPVNLSLETDFVSLYFEKPFVTLLPKDADDSTIVVKPRLKSKSTDAPIKKGDVLGTADIIYAENVIGTVNLVAGENIKSSKMLLVLRYIKSFFTSVYLKIFALIIIILIIIFIIMCIRLNYSKIKKRRVKYIPYGKGKGGKFER